MKLSSKSGTCLHKVARKRKSINNKSRNKKCKTEREGERDRREQSIVGVAGSMIQTRTHSRS